MSAQLERTFEAIKRSAEEHGLLIYPAIPAHDRVGPLVLWDSDWPEFLELATKAGARVLYTAAALFDLDEVIRQETGLDVDEWEDEGPEASEPDAQATWLRQRLLERVGQWSARNDEVMNVQCVWVKDGVTHWFGEFADWSEECRDAIREIVEEARATSASDREMRAAEESTRVYRRADQLAHHERFPEANSEAKRHFMAQQLFHDEVGLHRRIADLATLIYWWEVEPTERVSKAEKAQELYVRGESLANIAAILKMPEVKVRAAVTGVKRGSGTSNGNGG